MKEYIKNHKPVDSKEIKNVQDGEGIQSESNSDQWNLLTKREIEVFEETAIQLEIEGEYAEAVQMYDQLINNGYVQPRYYHGRASNYESLMQFDRAADDLTIAVELDPDNADHYWRLGGCLLSAELSKRGKLGANESKPILEDISAFYQIALQKDPANQCAWLDLIEIHLIARQWDDAICQYALCKSYIKPKPFQLIRSFLGTLALVINGEEAGGTDMETINDPAIRLSNGHYRLCEIHSLIADLEKSGFDPSRVQKAWSIYQLFVSHYDDEPEWYGIQDIDHQN